MWRQNIIRRLDIRPKNTYINFIRHTPPTFFTGHTFIRGRNDIVQQNSDKTVQRRETSSRRRPDPNDRRRKWLLFACLAVFAVLVTFRVLNALYHTPEYDEIWTVQNYVHQPVAKIVSDVSVPNNHVLNTLAIKFFLSFIPHRLLAIRMASLLGFFGLFFVIFRTSELFLRKNAARGALLAAVLLDGLILRYAETGRGYSLQIFFVSGVFLSLLCIALRDPKDRPFNACMWLVCALGACLSISTGALYVTILTGLWGLLYIPFRAGIKKIWNDYRALILAGLCWSAFVLIWYGGNYSKFAQGRADFGESFGSVPQYLRYCLEMLLDTGLIWALPIPAAGAVLLRRKPEWRICALTAGAAALMLGATLITKGGPARVYLPLLPVVFTGAAVALDELLKSDKRIDRVGPIVFLAVVLVCACFSESRRKNSADPEWISAFPELKALDSRIFIVYRPTDLFVLTTLFQDAIRSDNDARMKNPEMLLLLRDDFIATTGTDFVEGQNILPGTPPVSSGSIEAGQELPYHLYRLRPLLPGESLDGKTVLRFDSMPFPGNAEWPADDRFRCVNIMLFGGSSGRSYAAEGDGLDSDALLKNERNSSGGISFRVISE